MKEGKEERWLPVVRFEGIYEISDWGRTKRIGKATGATVGRILRPFPDKDGYYYVVLTVPGERYTARIHRLVAESFLGLRPDGLQVNHKDGVKTNNCLENLEYVTQSENQLHAFRLGLQCKPFGENNAAAKLTEDDVHEIRRLRGRKTGVAIAALFNVSPATISLILTGQRWGYLKEEDDDKRT